MSIPAEEIQQHHVVEIIVNNRPVRVEGPKATGLEIEEAAIAQGVPIQVSFQLSEKLGDHRTRVIGNDETISVHEGAVFVAIADDDNS
ncbi:MAG: multiubiquitin domain-containing protein [Acidimicrobiales bacterium]